MNQVQREVNALGEGPIGEVRLALSMLRITLDSIYAEGYLLDEWETDQGAGNLCGKKRAESAAEIIGDCINELPHELERLRTAVRNYAKSEGWRESPTLNAPAPTGS